MAEFNNIELMKLIESGNFAGVLLDLDDTLYAYEPCHQAGLAQAYLLWQKKTGSSYDEFIKSYKTAQQIVKANTHNQAASHSRLLYFQTMAEAEFGRSEFELTCKLESVYWDNFFNLMELRPGVEDLLKTLAERKIKICIVTDLTAALQFSKLIKLKLTDSIDFIVSSEEAGIEKPDAKIFQLAQAKLGVPRERLLMIGDDEGRDELGAKNFGIVYAHFSFR